MKLKNIYTVLCKNASILGSVIEERGEGWIYGFFQGKQQVDTWSCPNIVNDL